MVAQFRDRETEHGQSRDGPNRENAHNSNILIYVILTNCATNYYKVTVKGVW